MTEVPAARAPRAPSHRVEVTSFCAFVAKAGDLDLRFTPVPTAVEGLAGHRAVVFSRQGDYQSEVLVEAQVDGIVLRGRLDGLYADAALIDEIKTHRGARERIPANHTALHWAQLRTYGALYGRQHGLTEVTLRLCYFDIDAREEVQDRRCESVEELWDELLARVQVYKAWMAQQRAHWQRRDTLIDALAFPHASIAPGQAQLMRAVRKALNDGASLMAQAPTGVGKTLGVLFPALKAMSRGAIDRIFYLTARNTVQVEVDDALRSLVPTDQPLPLRVLLLAAKERACVFPDRACHGESCPRAKGFYDRLPAARAQAQHEHSLGAAQLNAIAAQHGVCPYFLAQEMTRWSDLVIGDVNYYFDSHAILYALTVQQGWRAAVLVDEAHNLIDRAREMYSGVLTQASIRAVARQVDRTLAPALGAIDRAIDDIAVLHEGKTDDAGQPLMPDQPSPALRNALADGIRRFGRWLAEDARRGNGPVLELYFDLLAMQRLTEAYGAHALCEIAHGDPQGQDLLRAPLAAFSVVNVVPAPHLLDRLRSAHAVIAFSATLTPPHYHQQMLGLPRDCAWCDVPSRFSAEQLQVRIVTRIPTTYRLRHRAARPIADLIATTFHERPGNYLAFFSSFAYLREIAQAFAERHADIAALCQTPAMGPLQRDGFLARFTGDSRQIGFAVLGGSFAEGINLPGQRLIGAFICNLGLTPFNLRSARMAQLIEAYFGSGAGQDFVYLYPAITKVIQAAGRVVRTTADHGTVTLIDQRFAQARIRKLLPSGWLP